MSEDPIDTQRSDLEMAADRARARLLGALSALDQKQKHLVEPVLRLEQASRSLPLLAGIGGAALLVAGGAAAGYALRGRKKTKNEERLAALVELWQHPDRALKRQPSMASVIARRVLIGAAVVAVSEPTKRVVRAAVVRVLEELAQRFSTASLLALPRGAPEIKVRTNLDEAVIAPSVPLTESSEPRPDPTLPLVYEAFATSRTPSDS